MISFLEIWLPYKDNKELFHYLGSGLIKWKNQAYDFLGDPLALHTPTAGSLDSILGQETRSYMLQIRLGTAK